MGYVILNRWDAVEIFCRILVRYKKQLTLQQFQNNEMLKRMFDEFSRDENWLDVSGKIFGVKKNKDNKIVPKSPKAFYELCRKIKNSIPVVLSWEEYTGFMKYIKLPTETFPYRQSVLWQPSDVQRKLEGKKWLIYYLHREGKNGNEEGKDFKRRHGIATAILELKPFAKAEIKGFKTSECYEGKFETYNKDEKFIRLKMRLKEHRSKDLSMLIYLVDGDVKLALGQYHNLGRSIYSGTVMIEPVLQGDEKEKKIQFYTGDQLKSLPAHVQDYFSDKSKNMLRVPCKVTSVSDYDEWREAFIANNENKQKA